MVELRRTLTQSGRIVYYKEAMASLVTDIVYTLKNLKFSTRIGTIVDRKEVLKQAEVVYDIKSQ